MLEPLLAEIAADGWYVKIIEVNATTRLDLAQATPPRCWWVDLHLPSAGYRKHGYGPDLPTALAAAWAADTLGEPLRRNWHHEQFAPKPNDLLSIMRSAKPSIYRRK